MAHKMKSAQIFAMIIAMMMLLSLFPAAAAEMPADVIDAKDDIATVDITQVCNGTEKDFYTHNYATDGDEVQIAYSATLYMTEEMAMYLQARQSQLMNAKFNVHVMMDMDKLEFTEEGQTLTVIFTSSFLKPWDVDANDIRTYKAAFSDYKAGNYSSEFLGRSADGFYSYKISINKAWAQSYGEKHGYIDVPMELIVYYDGKTAYSYEDIPAGAAGEKAMFNHFSVADWMKEIKVEVAGLRVKDSVRESVTYDPATWKTVEAQGTIDGEFTYVKLYEVNTIGDYKRLSFSTNTLEFGNPLDNDPDDDPAIEEWTSNVVKVRLIRQASGGTGSTGEPESPYLNLEDHFAYIIGYPVDYITGEPTDDMSRWPVKPEGTITRAEVATIFFRMLTDEVRNQYWSQTNPYNDVKLSDWFNNAISTLTNLGVIEGYPDGSFQPNGKITRAEFATMAVRFFIVTEEYVWDEDAFSDIATHWANEYINLAYLLDIVDGYPDGTFKPQNAITRAEAMTIVNNTLRRTPCNEGIQPMEGHEDFITWPDNMDKTKWYYAAVQEATNSHEYTYFTEPEKLLHKELWQDILPVRDWAAFERAWSDANSAANPGEVVGGH